MINLATVNNRIISGWGEVPYASMDWSYASATTINAVSSASSYIQAGMLLEIVQGVTPTSRFFIITAVSSILITVVALNGTDVVANSTILSARISLDWNPYGTGVNMPFKFYVNRNGTDQTGVATGGFTTVDWTTESYDDGARFDLANNYYVIPITGKYRFIFKGSVLSMNGQLRTRLLLNSVSIRGQNITPPFTAVNGHCISVWESSVSKDTTIEAQIRHDHGSNRDINGSVGDLYFSGCLIGI